MLTKTVKLSLIRCMDCGRDTGDRGLKEYPLMLRDEVWLSITPETAGEGVLCRADMEQRLGRSLVEADMARTKFCNCGRKITVFYQGRVYVPEDHHHDLCQKCWKAEKDRERVKEPTE